MLNPLAPVTDYQSMLNRIFWFTTAAALAAVWLLRLRVPVLNEALHQLDVAPIAGDKTLPAGYLLPALAVGVLTRVFRLHARLSDLLGIRECFDIDVIIAEFARQLGIDLAPLSPARLRADRPAIMRQAFYRYVASSSPQIDLPLVHQALDAWSWFWTSLEATCLFTLTSFALIATGAHRTGLQTLGYTLAFALIGLPALRRQCQRYAIAQVRAILADRTRAAAVRHVFAELTGERPAVRLAA
jgi:hypothetical protein